MLDQHPEPEPQEKAVDPTGPTDEEVCREEAVSYFQWRALFQAALEGRKRLKGN